MTTPMPVEDLAGLSLFQATREQEVEAGTRSHPKWGNGMPLEDYIGRPSRSLGKSVSWVLAPRNDSSALDFRCACETKRRTAWIYRKGSEAPELVTAYCVASVFTPERNRGKGYARHMMSLLHWVLSQPEDLRLGSDPFPAAWGAPPSPVEGIYPAPFSTLYSDIGKVFYGNCSPSFGKGDGWIVRDGSSTFWDVDKIASITAGTEESNWVFYGKDDIHELWTRDSELMKQDIVNIDQSTSGPVSVAVGFRTDDGVAAYQMRRSAYFQRLSGHPHPLSHYGVSLSSDDETPNLQFASWAMNDPPSSTLVINRLRTSVKDFLTVLAAAAKVAKDSELTNLEIWNLPAALAEKATELGAKTEERSNHLPAFKWYGKEKEDDVYWAFNEQYAWS